MTKAGIYNKRVNGTMRRVRINAKGQWKFLKGKPRATPRSAKPKHQKPKHHKSQSKKSSPRKRRRGWIFG